MKETLFVPYPQKLVPNSVLRSAQSIDDVRDNIQYDICDTFLWTKYILQYINNEYSVNLWTYTLNFVGNVAYLTNFNTANLVNIDEDFKCRTNAAKDIHVLGSSVKYIGKELFAKALDVCRDNKISIMYVFPLKISGSENFYKKMPKYFPDRISSLDLNEEWNLVFCIK